MTTMRLSTYLRSFRMWQVERAWFSLTVTFFHLISDMMITSSYLNQQSQLHRYLNIRFT